MEDTDRDNKQVAAYLTMDTMTVYQVAQDEAVPVIKETQLRRVKKDLVDPWFIRRLTDKEQAFEAPAVSNPVSLGSAGKAILIVDDEPSIREFFSQMLLGHTVMTASCGEEALGSIKIKRPDLILLDLKMPGMDGIETLRRMKEFDRSLVVIMLSAYGSLKNNLEAVQLGVFSCIAKPFDVKEMQILIDRALTEEKSRPILPEE